MDVVSEADWRPLAEYLHGEIGHEIETGKFYRLDRQCRSLLVEHALEHPRELVDHAQRHPDLRQRLIDAVTINESLFFRDERFWDSLATRILPDIVEEIRFKRRLDILLCACATGQELYSLMILCRELQHLLASCQVHVVATDIDETAMARARDGIYTPFEVNRGLSSTRQQRWFQTVDGGLQADRSLLDGVEFKLLNLSSPFRFAQRFDLIFCRNVLIYFDVPGKKQVLDQLADHINGYGFLALGGAESMIDVNDRWATRMIGQWIYYQTDYDRNGSI